MDTLFKFKNKQQVYLSEKTIFIHDQDDTDDFSAKRKKEWKRKQRWLAGEQSFDMFYIEKNIVKWVLLSNTHTHKW